MQIRRLMRRLCSVAAALILTMNILPVRAFAAKTGAVTAPIKVFFPLQTGFAEMDENGKYSGYTYEYLMRIAQLTGWIYEFVPVEVTNESLSAGLDKVSKGELQLAGAMNYSDELAEKYEYSVSYGETNYALVTCQNNEKLNARTLLDYPNLKVAMVEAAKGQNGLFDEFCKIKGLSYTPVYAENSKACRTLMENGLADVVISKDVANNMGLKIVAKFSPTPFYFASSKGNTELIQQLNQALNTIAVSDPGFNAKLHEKYFSRASDFDMSLTVEETEYLKNAPVIRVAVPVDRAPVQDYDEKTGEFNGIIIDILEKMSVKSGLKFELIKVNRRDQLKQLIEEGGCDIVAGVSYVYDQGLPVEGSENNILRTPPILSAPIIRIHNNLDEARNDGILVADSIKKFEGSDNIKYLDDLREIFDLVESGEYGQAYVNGYMAQRLMQEKYYRNVSLAFTAYGNYELCLGVSRKCDLRLVSILNQTISSLRDSEIEDIVYRNINQPTEANLWDTIRRDPTQVVIPVLVFLIVVVTLLLLLFFKTRRINKLISQEKNEYMAIAQSDRLSQTYNNAAFKQLANHYLSQEGMPLYGALLVCDIDNFKNINDTYGHLKGDEVISKMGNLMTTIFRGEDIVGRLGGDEFVIMLKHVASRSTIEKRCKELQEKSRSVIEEAVITLSIGVAMFHDQADFDELFKQADTALYGVKSSGKNGYRISGESKSDGGASEPQS